MDGRIEISASDGGRDRRYQKMKERLQNTVNNGWKYRCYMNLKTDDWKREG